MDKEDSLCLCASTNMLKLRTNYEQNKSLEAEKVINKFKNEPQQNLGLDSLPFQNLQQLPLIFQGS